MSLGGLCILVILIRLCMMGFAHLRHLVTLAGNPDRQTYWEHNHNYTWAWIKKHFLYAPFWNKRHCREYRLSRAINMGTFPSRLHTTIVAGYLISNIIYTVALLDYSEPKPALLAEIRGRSGVLAVVNMIPLILLAGRNNPLIPLMRVSFDTYNLLHRWMGRIVVIEALVHTSAWMANKVLASGWSAVWESWGADGTPFIRVGLVSMIALLFILVQSLSPIRHAFYETFLHLHQIAAAITIVTLYFHLSIDSLPQLPFVQIIIGIWAFERIVRFLRIAYRNVSRKGPSGILVEALPGDACRVTIEVARPWKFKPGAHVYLYMPTIGLWMSHPFSVAWNESHEIGGMDNEKAERGSKLEHEIRKLDKKVATRNTISLVISKHTGFTEKLYNRAVTMPQKRLTTWGFVEGPYGAMDSLHSYGTVVMFAGGIGITHQVPHVRDLLRGYADGSVSTRKILLVWSVKSTEHLEWVRPWMDQILQMPHRREVLRILLFVTKPKSPREVISPSATVQMFPGRMNAPTIIDKEVVERKGAMAVTVCGSGAFADEVRMATRRRVDQASITFIEEAFTW
jgi:predicted ferric reductase